MAAIEERRSIGVRHLLIAFSAKPHMLGPSFQRDVEAAYDRAEGYGLEIPDDFVSFLTIDPRFELRPGYEEARRAFMDDRKTATERVFYAGRACKDVSDAALGPGLGGRGGR